MDGMAADDASPASAVRERYERMFKEKQRGPGKGLVGGSLPGDPAAAALAAQGQAVRTAFQGSISSVFTKHLRYAPHLLTPCLTLSQGINPPLQASTSSNHLTESFQVTTLVSTSLRFTFQLHLHTSHQLTILCPEATQYILERRDLVICTCSVSSWQGHQ